MGHCNPSSTRRSTSPLSRAVTGQECSTAFSTLEVQKVDLNKNRSPPHKASVMLTGHEASRATLGQGARGNHVLYLLQPARTFAYRGG